MDKRPILFLDSGIGGIPYCRHFYPRNPSENIVYLADRLHFPYGGRTADALVSILLEVLQKIIAAFDPKIAVLACNTATVSALDELRARYTTLPFVGTVPAVKPAALASAAKKIGVLGTGRTIDDPYISKLAARAGGCELRGIAAPDLVEFVENRLDTASADEKREIVLSYINRFRALGVDALVLGCTHFLYLQEEFRREAAPDITVFDSLEGITCRVESLLDDENKKLRTSSKTAAVNRLLLTGKNAPELSWQKRAEYMGFELCLLEDM